MIYVVVWFLLFFLFPIVMLPGFGVLDVGIWESLSLAICSGWLAYYSANVRGQIVGIFFWIFSYVFMVVAPSAQAIAGGYPWFDYYSPEYVNKASLFVFIGLLSTTAGALSVSRFDQKGGVEVNKKKLELFLYFSLVVTVLSIAVLGGKSIFSVRAEQYEASGGATAVTVLVQAFMRVPLFVVSLILLQDLLKVGVKSSGWLKVFGVVALILVVLTINNPISTPRFWFACILLSYILLFVSSLKANLERFLAPTLLFLLLVVFPLSDMFRRTTDVDVVGVIKTFELYEEISLSPDYDAFQQLINTLVTVDSRGHTFGNQLLGAFLFWVPRSAWPGKPIPSGEYVVEEKHYSFVNLSCPLWAEIYLDFGLVGLIIVFFMYGVLIRFSSRQSGVWLVYFMFFATFQPYFLRGSLMVASNFLLLSSACFIAVSRKTRE